MQSNQQVENYKQYNQSGGFLWSLIKTLFWIIFFIILIFGLIFYFLVNAMRESALVRYPCMLTGSAIFVLLTGIIEIVTAFIPPVAIWLIPLIKVLDTYSLVCSLLDPETGFMDMIVGILALLPIGGAVSKFVKFYRKTFG